MPTYGSYIAAAQAVYDGLTAANFPGAALWLGPYLDEAPATDESGNQIRTRYVVIRDLGGGAKWTFTGDAGKATPGQNALVTGEFVVEAYALTLADVDAAMAAILWNGQVPNERAGLAFATLNLTPPLKAVGGPVPTKDQRAFAGVGRGNTRLHVAKQWFTVKTAISGDGS